MSSPDDLPHVYNPYGNVAYPATYPTYPAGLGPETAPVRRPGAVHLGLLLLVLAALPFVAVGAIAVAAAQDAAAAVPPDQLAQLQQLGVDLTALVRTTGLLMLAVAAVFVLLAVLTWTGRSWARALLAAMTAGVTLLVVGSLLAASAQGMPTAGAGLLLAPVVLAVAGLALMFRARAWFDRPRR